MIAPSSGTGSALPTPGRASVIIGLAIGYSAAALLYLAKGLTAAPLVIFSIATGIALCALFVPTAYRAIHSFFARAGHVVGVGIAYLLLVPLFYLFFTPIRVYRTLAGKDPLRLRADGARASYWEARPADTDPTHYRRQY